MSAKADFAKARRFVEQAEKLTLRHLSPNHWHGTFLHFTRLRETLSRLAILGTGPPRRTNGE